MLFTIRSGGICRANGWISGIWENWTLKSRIPIQFYGLALAYEAGRRGGSLPTVFNAANERAVQLFLERKIGYLEIPKIIKECMERHKNVEQPSLEEILDTEEGVYEYINSRK